MTRRRSRSLEFKRRIAHEFLASETLQGLSERHDASRIPIRVWAQKREAGVFDQDAAAANPFEQHEARTARARPSVASTPPISRDRRREFSPAFVTVAHST
jgi:hypothetical protein